MSTQNICNYADVVLRDKSCAATATIKGGSKYPLINGNVWFYPVNTGTLVIAEIYNLPENTEATQTSPQIGPFGFHIHEKGDCCPSSEGVKEFSCVGGHYNPKNVPHPHHAGDMPVLFSDDGYAYLSFISGRFNVPDIVGRAVIIHQSPDDFRTQPSGNSGEMIACGRIFSCTRESG